MGRGKRYEKKEKKYTSEIILVILIFIVIIFGICYEGKIGNNNKNDYIKSETYYSVNKDDKWGVIDNNGKVIIPIEYTSQLIVPNPNENVFICKYEEEINSGIFKYKAINSNQKQIMTQFDQVIALSNHDENGNLQYNLNVIKVIKDNKCGLIDYSGNIVLDCIYDDIYELDNVKNSIVILKDNKKGLINDKGNNIIECKYSNILNIGSEEINGFITVDFNNKYGVVNQFGKIIINNKYDEIKSKKLDNKYIVKINSKYSVINDKDEIIVENFDNILDVNNNYVIIEKNKKYGVIDLNNSLILDYKYQKIKFGNKNQFIVKQNDLYGIIDNNKNKLMDIKYNNIIFHINGNIYELENNNYQSDIYDSNLNYKMSGIISEYNNDNNYFKIYINNDYHYYDFNFQEQNLNELVNQEVYIKKDNGKYGLVDKSNNFITNYIYEDIKEPNKLGYIPVKKDGLWGCIDLKGKTVLEPKYKLENNVIIDFIGQWHISSNLDYMYYTDKDE